MPAGVTFPVPRWGGMDRLMIVPQGFATPPTPLHPEGGACDPRGRGVPEGAPGPGPKKGVPKWPKKGISKCPEWENY